jgi:ABC-2 type transport system permease protein
MNKISLIIKREYLTRVKKKSFIIMTILGPVLMAGLMIVPIWMSRQKPDKQEVEVIDESYLFKDLIPQKEFIDFDYPDVSFIKAQESFYDSGYDAILYIPSNILEGGKTVKIFYKKQIGIATEEYIASTISKMMCNVLLAKNKVDVNTIKDAEENSKLHVITEKLEATGKSKKTNTGLLMRIGIGAGLLIYFFIFLYGVQVMRGVMEEKTSRIVEVILSSVKPFQLMMGKIIGVALVGLTQFLLWVVLTLTLYSVATVTILKNIDIKQIQQKEQVLKIGADLNYQAMKKLDKPNVVTEEWNEFQTVDMLTITFCFLFYFLAGYLLYSALFAAVGAAVDNEADTQQFMLPITIPLIFSFVIAQTVIENPDSSMAFWFSIIPFTSPVIMMVRMPFGVPPWEVALSMGLLVLGFVFTTWLASRIYRTGILMYGKKITWKELGKWLFYKG